MYFDHDINSKINEPTKGYIGQLGYCDAYDLHANILNGDQHVIIPVEIEVFQLSID